MKPRETDSRRGGSARQVHHKDTLMHYNPDQDRSEQCGWTKFCDESVPTESEQDFWGGISVMFALAIGAAALVFL